MAALAIPARAGRRVLPQGRLPRLRADHRLPPVDGRVPRGRGQGLLGHQPGVGRGRRGRRREGHRQDARTRPWASRPRRPTRRAAGDAPDPVACSRTSRLRRQRGPRAGEGDDPGARWPASSTRSSASPQEAIRPGRRPGLRGRSPRRALRPVDVQPRAGPAHARQRGLHPDLRQGRPAARATTSSPSTRSGWRSAARAEGRAVSFQMVTDDIYAVSKGRLVGRPR